MYNNHFLLFPPDYEYRIYYCRRLYTIILICTLCFSNFVAKAQATPPIKIGIAGLSHDHVNWIFNTQKEGQFVISGIAEPNRALAKKYSERYNFPMSLVFSSLEEMVDSTKPSAVTAFGSIYSHLNVVEICAPRGIHVMVEKPLAVNKKHANKMKKLAKKNNIHLITNFETTWYASNHKAYHTIVEQKQYGQIRKIIVRDGHRGPREIGCSEEFLQWLTDPVLNGGGAIVDFGCYGANLATWFMKNEKPISVTALTQQMKPEIYPNVDDEATILLEYTGVQVIIQASWNWPISRKDMEIYGERGVFIAHNSTDIEFGNTYPLVKKTLPAREHPNSNPFSYLTAIIRGDIKIHDLDLSSLANNLIVVEILDAARKSAATGKKVYLK